MFELCVDSVFSAQVGISMGVSSLELCSSLILGGLTPSLGLVAAVARRIQRFQDSHFADDDAPLESQKVGRPLLRVLVRPRAGDFVYTDDEIEVMLNDIRLLKGFLVHGIVVGCLDASGNVDIGNTQRLVLCAREVGIREVTFHRAIDQANDLLAAVEVCHCQLHIDRILSSGGQASAVQGVDMLGKMATLTRAYSMSLVAAAGINESCAQLVLQTSGCNGLHGSCTSSSSTSSSLAPTAQSSNVTAQQQYQKKVLMGPADAPPRLPNTNSLAELVKICNMYTPNITTS